MPTIIINIGFNITIFALKDECYTFDKCFMYVASTCCLGYDCNLEAAR